MKQAFQLKIPALLYAARILLGCLITWWSLFYLTDTKKIWAIISVIIVSEPDFTSIRQSMVSRIINTVTGCVLGLIFIAVFGLNFWSMIGAVGASAITATTFPNYPSSWKLAPVTVIIIMMPVLPDGYNWDDSLLTALMRTGEVLYGSFVAFVLGWLFTEFFKKRFPLFEEEGKGHHE
ncbi:MAG: FUSC family protein [Bacteroidia bacterium]